MSARQSRFSVGDTIDGKYEVVQALAAGGMGELYKVRHLHLGDYRVVKVLKSNLLSDETQKQRFLREAKIAASIKNPFLAALYDFSSLADGSYYMVIEFINGVTLADKMKTGEHFELPFVLRVAQQVLSGLSTLHQAGIVHRDISPDNLMVTRENGVPTIKIIDLGIAKPVDAGEGLTSDGFFVGKLHYASPEQAGMLEPGEKIDQRTDLYSLGVVLYQMVAERMPFEANSPQTYFVKQISEEVRPINIPDQMPSVPFDVETFILRLLKRKRSERFSDAQEALAHLARISPPSASYPMGTAAQELSAEEAATETEAAPAVSDAEPFEQSEAPPEAAAAEPFEQPEAPPEAPLEEKPAGPPEPSPSIAYPPMIPETIVFDPRALQEEVAASQSRAAEASPPPSGEVDEGAAETVLASTEDLLRGDRTVVQDVPVEEPPPSAPSEAGASSLASEILNRRTPDAAASMPTVVDESDYAVDSMKTVVEQPIPPAAPPPPPSFAPEPSGITPGGTVMTPMPPPDVVAGPPPRSPVVPIAIAVVLLVILAGGGYFAYSKLNKGEPPGTDTAESTTIAQNSTSQTETTPFSEDTAMSTMAPNVMDSPNPTPAIFVPPPLSQTLGPPVALKPTPTPRRERPGTPAKVQPTVAAPTPTPAPVSTPTPPPTPSVKVGELVTSGAGVVDAKIVKWFPPTYPRVAERVRAEGTTEMLVLVDENGQPSEVKVIKSSGFSPLDEEAQRVAMKSTYSAATKQGVRVKMWIPMKVSFKRP